MCCPAIKHPRELWLDALANLRMTSAREVRVNEYSPRKLFARWERDASLQAALVDVDIRVV